MAARGKKKGLGDKRCERERRARIRAQAAESSGRRVGSTLADYEAILPQGDKRVAQALISRHNVRMENIAKTFDDYRFAAMSALVPIIFLSRALKDLGASPRRPPPVHVGSVPDLLAWGVDSAVAAARLLLAGQTLGAAVMIRNQLERWVSQRAVNLGLKQQDGESTVNFVARVWSHPDAFHGQWYEKHVEVTSYLYEDGDVQRGDFRTPEHLHVYRSDGTDVCPALTYELLSEFIHLRAFEEASYWDAELLVQNDALREAVMLAAGAVCDAIFLALREIRLSVLELAKRRGHKSAVEVLSIGMDAISMSDHQTDLAYEAIPFSHPRMRETLIPPVAVLAPLLPREGLSNGMVSVVRSLSDDYQATLSGIRPAGRLYQDDEYLVRAFAWHRYRSILVASQALEAERRQLGADFNIDSLTGRSAKWVILSEATSLLAIWHQVPGVKKSAGALASSLRSAYWLWLEDDDRAMAVLRSCLEYVARLRTWRRKPGKATNLEANPATTPRDWITQAGWKRLHLLNYILGEFAHARSINNWPNARRLLSELQVDVDAEKAIFTARGAAIDFTASLAVREVVALISEMSADLGSAMGRILHELDFELDENAPDVEAHFAHIWSVRSRQAP